MLLRVTDGTTTITLTSSPWLGATYFPAPEGDDAEVVTETAICTIEGTEAAIRTAVLGVETLLRRASARVRLLGARVFVEWRPLDAGDILRSEISAGQVTWSSDPARRRLGATLNTVEIAITWTRANWWEDTTLTELQLSTSNQAAATGGRTIVNHDDAETGDDNWVQIAGAQVEGVLDAPLHLQLANASGGARTYERVYVAINAHSDPANFPHMLEAESGSGGTATADATCSNGSKLRVTVNTTATVAMTLSAALLQDTQGRDFLLIARSAAINGPVTVRPQIRSGSVVLWSGERVVVEHSNSAVYNLGAVPLPPGGWHTGWGALSLVLAVTSSASVTWDIDFVQLTPLDALRVLELFTNASIANGGLLVDNNIEGVAYVEVSGAASPMIAPRGDALVVFAGRTQRIIVLQQTGSGAAIADAFTLRAWYRKRVRAVS